MIVPHSPSAKAARRARKIAASSHRTRRAPLPRWGDETLDGMSRSVPRHSGRGVRQGAWGAPGAPRHRESPLKMALGASTSRPKSPGPMIHLPPQPSRNTAPAAPILSAECPQQDGGPGECPEPAEHRLARNADDVDDHCRRCRPGEGIRFRRRTGDRVHGGRGWRGGGGGGACAASGAGSVPSARVSAAVNTTSLQAVPMAGAIIPEHKPSWRPTP